MAISCYQCWIVVCYCLFGSKAIIFFVICELIIRYYFTGHRFLVIERIGMYDCFEIFSDL